MYNNKAHVYNNKAHVCNNKAHVCLVVVYVKKAASPWEMRLYLLRTKESLRGCGCAFLPRNKNFSLSC